MVVFQKLEGKTTTLKFWNQKLEGKTTTLNFWNQKLEGKTTTLKNWIKKMEGNSTTPKNCVLTDFLHERSTIFLLLFSLIWFWILLRNDFCSNFRQSQLLFNSEFRSENFCKFCGLSWKRKKICCLLIIPKYFISEVQWHFSLISIRSSNRKAV